MPGFALGCFASFKPFWPLPLVQLALVAIIFQALRRFRGAVLFRSLRPSSSWGFPFWLLGLTVQSSRPAFGRRLTLSVRPQTEPSIFSSLIHTEVKLVNKTALIAAILLLPLSALARGSSGLGTWLILAATLGAAYLMVLFLFGGPIILINKLSGRPPNDDIGGKVFALSFLFGPFLGVPLMYVFDRSDSGWGLLLGWVASIFILNSVLSRNKD